MKYENTFLKKKTTDRIIKYLCGNIVRPPFDM